MLCFAALAKSGRLAKKTFGVAAFQIANAGVHRPARAAGFHNRPLPIEPDVADLGFARTRSVIDRAVNDQPATYPAAKRYIKYRIAALASPAQGFAQGRDVRV